MNCRVVTFFALGSTPPANMNLNAEKPSERKTPANTKKCKSAKIHPQLIPKFTERPQLDCYGNSLSHELCNHNLDLHK